jgi:hypothetical protein
MGPVTDNSESSSPVYRKNDTTLPAVHQLSVEFCDRDIVVFEDVESILLES